MNWSELDTNQDELDLADAYFVFGLHKCGSSLMHKMVRTVCDRGGIPSFDMPGLAFKEGIRPEQWATDEALVPLFKRRRVYYGFRFLPKLLLYPDLEIREKKFVLLVRDPRDALVSQFFSFGGKHLSHAMPKKNADVFLDKIQKTADLDIDEYVLEMAGPHLRKMTDYRDRLDFDKGLLRRYEDIYYDKETFLRDIFAHFGLEVPAALIKRVAEQNDVRPVEEDITRHIRKGTPGDHTEKLKPETVRQLNAIFTEIASAYGYDLEA